MEKDLMNCLFAGTPPLMAVKLLLAFAAMNTEHVVMIIDVKCAFLYGWMKRRVYIELPSQDPLSSQGNLARLLNKAMFGTRDAPRIWSNEVT